jgi:hypothetical protein
MFFYEIEIQRCLLESNNNICTIHTSFERLMIFFFLEFSSLIFLIFETTFYRSIVENYFKLLNQKHTKFNEKKILHQFLQLTKLNSEFLKT